MFKETISASAAVALTIGLSACSGPNHGKEFVAKGVVREFDDKSIELTDTQVIEGDKSLFKDETEKMYDTYKDPSCFEKETTEDLNLLIKTGKIAVGNTVIVHGSIGQNTENCFTPGYNKGAFPNSNYPLIDTIKVQE